MAQSQIATLVVEEIIMSHKPTRLRNQDEIFAVAKVAKEYRLANLKNVLIALLLERGIGEATILVPEGVIDPNRKRNEGLIKVTLQGLDLVSTLHKFHHRFDHLQEKPKAKKRSTMKVPQEQEKLHQDITNALWQYLLKNVSPQLLKQAVKKNMVEGHQARIPYKGNIGKARLLQILDGYLE